MTSSTDLGGQRSPAPAVAPRRIHPAWWVAAVAFVAIIGAAGFRATPGVLITPLQEEFGWSRATISAAVSVNLLLFGLTAPFAAALMDRFGMRRVVAAALVLVAAGSGLTVFMTASWQLILLWGVLVGLGTGSMALVFVATVTGRWFVKHRGVVTGVAHRGRRHRPAHLPAGRWPLSPSARGWRVAALTVDGRRAGRRPAGGRGSCATIRPTSGSTPYGAPAGTPVAPPPRTRGAARRALRVLRTASRTSTFWLLVGRLRDLRREHQRPDRHALHPGRARPRHARDHRGRAARAGRALRHRRHGRVRLAHRPVRLAARCSAATTRCAALSLLVLPSLIAATAQPSMLVFIIFYGLDWVATVPPTIALCRQHFGDDGPVVFGWVFASHQVGAAVAATGAGAGPRPERRLHPAWVAAGMLCFFAAVMSVRIRASVRPVHEPHRAMAAA